MSQNDSFAGPSRTKVTPRLLLLLFFRPFPFLAFPSRRRLLYCCMLNARVSAAMVMLSHRPLTVPSLVAIVKANLQGVEHTLAKTGGPAPKPPPLPTFFGDRAEQQPVMQATRRLRRDHVFVESTCTHTLFPYFLKKKIILGISCIQSCSVSHCLLIKSPFSSSSSFVFPSHTYLVAGQQ